MITHSRGLVARGKAAHADWQQEFEAWATREPERKALLDRLLAGALPDGWDADLPHWEPGSKAVATRAASGKVLSAVACSRIVSGSADLAGNNTTMKWCQFRTDVDSPGTTPPTVAPRTPESANTPWGAILSGIVPHGPTSLRRHLPAFDYDATGGAEAASLMDTIPSTCVDPRLDRS